MTQAMLEEMWRRMARAAAGGRGEAERWLLRLYADLLECGVLTLEEYDKLVR